MDGAASAKYVIIRRMDSFADRTSDPGSPCSALRQMTYSHVCPYGQSFHEHLLTGADMPKKICTTIRITGLAGLLALTLTACTPITEPPHSITYQSIMISAEWRGTSGTPVISSQEVPPKWNGSKCPTASLKTGKSCHGIPGLSGGK